MIQNNFNFIGRLVKDPNYFAGSENKKAYCQLSLAVDGGKDAQGEDKVDFITLSAFGNTADYIGKYCKKGTMIACDGKVDTSKQITVLDSNQQYNKRDVQFIINDVRILVQPMNG